MTASICLSPDHASWKVRHGPSPGCQEAEAEAFSILEAKALTLFKLEAKAEAEALVTKPKPGYLYTTHHSTCTRLVAKWKLLVNNKAEAFAKHLEKLR